MSNEKKDNEEVDLGSLFILIGKGFSKLFHFIGQIFKGIFNFFIQVLLFLKSNLLKIGASALIGGIIGLFVHFNSEAKYEAHLLVKPNFKSSRQLYNNINYYNDLVKQKDTVLLVETFDISIVDARSLKKFEINPIINNNDIVTAYDELILSIDTLTVKSFSFDQFKSSFTNYDYNVHDIRVVATQNNVFQKLSKTIISSITENSYFKNLKKLNQENLERTNSLLLKNLTQADSLHNIYKKVLLEEAKKTSSGTQIDMGSQKGISRELELFKTNATLSEDLKDISEDLSEKSEIINVISNFQPVGHQIKEIQRNYTFQLAVLGALGMVLFLLLRKLNKYLESYKS
ncbi:hypothetical protein [Tenacibaculum sp. IB213877]|uniref:hypothetical protein n=1 Tax=Tenacibaculum sp. IB213877 TaxID=3097351 RepID=UPI002A5A8BE8|nr:hypothetical protein [Tenacibaculum sp. IB213877]MDY0780405.1 hypothetical protein [Tenacibaculum sp. IB213877]